MATQVSCSDQSLGEPIAKRAKHVRVTETSTTCSEEHTIIESPETSELNECVDEQHAGLIETLVPKPPDPVEGRSCSNCTVLPNTVRKLKNRIVSLENNVKKWKLSNRRSNYHIKGEYRFC